MSHRLLPVVLLIAPVLAYAAEDKEKKPLDAQQTAAAFLDAALNGRYEDAAAMGEPGQSPGSEKGAKQFARFKVKQLAIEDGYTDEQDALFVTAGVTDDRGEAGVLVLILVKKDDAWLVRDIDFEDDGGKSEVKRFLDKHPKAKKLPKPKQKDGEKKPE